MFSCGLLFFLTGYVHIQQVQHFLGQGEARQRNGIPFSQGPVCNQLEDQAQQHTTNTYASYQQRIKPQSTR